MKKIFTNKKTKLFQVSRMSILLIALIAFISAQGFAQTPVITITKDPTSISVTFGNITETLSVEASVTQGATLNYEWLEYISGNFVSVPGGTEAVLAIPPTLTVGEHRFLCKISVNGSPNNYTQSKGAIVTVIQAGTPVITITNNLSSQAVEVIANNITESLSITANVTEGATLSYQWYWNTQTASTEAGDRQEIPGAISSTFPIPTTLTPTGGASGGPIYYYYCKVSVTANPTIFKYSAIGVVRVKAAGAGPVINVLFVNPAGPTVTEGQISGSLTVTATVDPSETQLNYQWYSNTTESNSGGTAIVGANSVSFPIPDTLKAARSPYYYYCMVSATGAVSKPSLVVVVTVRPYEYVQPVISISPNTPADITVEENRITENLAVAAKAEPNVPLDFQWYSNTENDNTTGTPIGDATDPMFPIPANLTVAGSPYYYYCIVSATDAAPVTSRVATVSVVPEGAPVITITTQPAASTTVSEGSITGSLSVTATANKDNVTLTYQWYANSTNSNSNGTAITDATNATFPIPTNLTHAGSPYYYYCIVNAVGGAIPATSTVAVVTVDGVGVNTIDNPVMTVYPNPTTGVLYILMSDMRYQTSDIVIYDMLGRIQKIGKSEIGKSEINISHLPAGIYFMRVENQTVKIVKE